MKIAIFFLLTLAADGSDFSCDKGELPFQKKNLVIDTTFCSDTNAGKAFQRNYTQGAEKCCDLKYACLQICGIDKKQCNKFGSLKKKSSDCVKERCKNEQDKEVASACEKDFQKKLEETVQKKFRKPQPCTCAKKKFVKKRREKELNDFAKAKEYEEYDVKDCLKNVDYSDNTEVAERFLKIIKTKVTGTNVCEISRHKLNEL